MARRTLLAMALAAPSIVSAQTAPNDGWALDRFEPAPAGDVFFVADHPWYSSTRAFAAGLALDHAVDPLVFTATAADGSQERLRAVSSMLTAHAGAAVSFADRVGLALSLPVALAQGGAPVADGPVVLGAAEGVAAGDLRFTARVRLAGHADADAFSLHLGAHLWAPLGSRARNTGDEGLRVEPRIIAAGRAGPVRWSAAVGYHVRPEHVASLAAVSHELRVTAAAGVTALDGRLTVGPEAYAYTSLGDPTGLSNGLFAKGLWGAEVMLGAHYLVADTLLVGVGGGVGLGLGYGLPAGRAMLSVAYAPVRRAEPALQRPTDADDDGVSDPDDLCPTAPRGEHPDPSRAGCPAADADGDGVVDALDRCVSEPQGARPDPSSAGCPQRDRDGDGLFDHEDACPEQAPGPTPDPARRGCPAADRDGDGVPDPADQCPDAPRSATPDPSRAGCPVADADRDLVPDAIDACAQQAGVPSADPRRNGCPSDRVQIVAGELVVRAPVVFAARRDRIKHDSRDALEAVAEVMRGAAFIRRLSIEGPVEARETPERSRALSEARARAVMRWLIQHGVAAARLDARGRGEGDARVRFRIVDPAAPVSAPVSAPASSAPDEGRHARHRRHHRRRR